MFPDKLTRLICNICPRRTSKSWDEFKIRLFWSCPEITRDQWVDRMTMDSFAAAGVIEDSLTYVNIRSFFTFFPVDIFHDKWPQMRLYCPKKLSRRRGLFDVAWSQLATGTCFVPPLQEWFSLPDKHKAIVAEVSRCLYMDKSSLTKRFEDISNLMQSSLEAKGFLRSWEDLVFPGILHRRLYNTRPPKKAHYIIK